MFITACSSRTLHSSGIISRHHPGQTGVFRKIFWLTSIQRIAVDIKRRCKDQGNPHLFCFLSDYSAYFFTEGLVKRGTKCYTGRHPDIFCIQVDTTVSITYRKIRETVSFQPEDSPSLPDPFHSPDAQTVRRASSVDVSCFANAPASFGSFRTSSNMILNPCF